MTLRRAFRHWLVLLSLVLLLLGLTVARTLAHAGGAQPTVGGLSVFVGYAEDKETRTPDPATFPVPWAGSPNTTFLGGTVPGQLACGTLTACYDAGAVRLDNPGTTAVTVTNVSVDDHSSLPGGKVFNNLWGSFSVPAGKSVILSANPPANNPNFDNFDTSSFPSSCTPLTVAPTVTFTIGGKATTLADSTHVLDTGGIDVGSCTPKRDESVQWRPIGAAGTDSATLALGPPTAVAGQPTTETATLLDGSGTGSPNATVAFRVTSGPDAGTTGTGVTDSSGHASFTYTGAQGEDVISAGVTTVGTISSNTAHVLWTDHSATGWTGSDVGGPAPAGGQSLDPATGTWTINGGGGGIGGTSDQFYFVHQTVPSGTGVAARVASQAGGGAGNESGVMLRTSTAPDAPFYAAMVTPGNGIEVEDRSGTGGSAVSVLHTAGTVPAYLWVTNSGTTITTYGSPDGTTWSPIPGSTVNLALGSTLLGGMVESSATPGVGATTTMDSIVVSSSPPAALPPTPCPSPYTCADVGTPAPAGNQSFDPGSGTWTINAGGADITGTSDQFRFISQPVTGDGNLGARVASQANTSTNAKAGVMLRATSDPGSPYYAVLVSPGAGIKVQERSTQGGTTTKLANPAGTVPAYLEVSRTGSTFTASTSTNGTTWSPIAGSAATLNLGGSPLGGLAATSHRAGVLGTVTMDTVQGSLLNTTTSTTTTSTSTTTTSTSTTTSTTTTTPPPTCPSPYTCADIGTPAPAGNQSFDAGTGTWTINGGGADITGTSDHFRFVSQPVTGDGSVSAHVTSQANTSTNAKAGVMLRATSDPGSPCYAVLVSPGAGIKVQVRSTLGGTTTKLANPAGTVPTYLKVSRSGNTFSASTSANGVTWSPIAGSTVVINLGASLLGGLAVTSHHAGVLGTVTMDTVTVS